MAISPQLLFRKIELSSESNVCSLWLRTTDPQVPSLNKAGTFVFMNDETFFEVDFFTQVLDISVIFK